MGLSLDIFYFLLIGIESILRHDSHMGTYFCGLV